MPNIIIDTQFLTETDQLRLRVLNVKERTRRLGISQLKPIYQYRFGSKELTAYKNTMSALRPNADIVQQVETLVQEMEDGAVKKAVNNPEAAANTFGRQAQKDAS